MLKILTKVTNGNATFVKFHDANGTKGLSDLARKTNFLKVV
ncbi:hypothetical protein J5U21_01753 [Saccharolobus shibatae]|uniref:Uncharacterized protein n=1 Tax=Saccharolobus shibatae TaxID=2286 RepID=A0A8F5GX52_9CREN|nr:hypothetical protein J5U21_01753 [Saccharolobus shibatae]